MQNVKEMMVNYVVEKILLMNFFSRTLYYQQYESPLNILIGN
jgi:hypothetical protein